MDRIGQHTRIVYIAFAMNRNERMMSLPRLCAGLLSGALLFFSCGGKTPPGVLDHDTFVTVYVALLAADSSASDSVRGTPEEIMARHNVTEQEMRATMEVYNADVVRWKEFYADVTKRLEAREEERRVRHRPATAPGRDSL